jgi:hypothetical protein
MLLLGTLLLGTLLLGTLLLGTLLLGTLWLGGDPLPMLLVPRCRLRCSISTPPANDLAV